MKPLAIVTDLDGTTSSIRFVKDVLFVYAEQFLPDFIRQNRNERDVARPLRSLSEKTGIEVHDTEGLIEQMQQWLREEKPVTELQSLLGLVWEKGYSEGEFQSHVYADVPGCLRKWLDQDINLYVFAPSSEKAQRLFFRYSSQGDLRLLFAGYFDNRLGPRRRSDTYRRMAESVALDPGQMLFISDTEQELDAAAEAGFHTLRMVRREELDKGPSEVHSAHPAVASFEDIDLGSL